MGIGDKFDQMKDQASDTTEDARDQADDLFNKAKESPAGDQIDEHSDDVEQRAQDAVSGMRGEQRE